ncbi:invasion associated locus B family protein [Iodidimonas sp. SYSU 1G8]|uniref:invasion associated locus B family protein n=1 Tax=Iodidimonas sp. SYSU 1G8 TaxID=3133967 RepID=UPI0031FE55E3
MNLTKAIGALRRTGAIGVFLGATLMGHGAAAQTPAGEVREDFGQWQLYCAAPKAGTPADCETHQLLKNKEGKLVAGMYLTRRGTSSVLMVRVPLGVLLARNPMLQLEGGIGTDALSYLRCDMSGCIAQMLATEPFLDSLRKGGKAKLTVSVDASRTIPIDFNLTGFADAEQALMKQAR